MEKHQRKLMRQAEQAAKRPPRRTGRRPQRREQQPVSKELLQEYCGVHYAVKVNGLCPACSHDFVEYDKFCRRCLRVHSVNKTDCEEWRPCNR